MSEIKLTKNELRAQQLKLAQLNKYLPTLQLKKAMLQSEVHEAKLELANLEKIYGKKQAEVEAFRKLLSEKSAYDLPKFLKVEKLSKRYENIAGVEIPIFEEVLFSAASYSLFDTAPWFDAAILAMKGLLVKKAEVLVGAEKLKALEVELREVSIRVNLFEKILIPRSKVNIRKIKVFLSDQQLAAVAQAKVAKGKIEAKKEEMLAVN